MNLKTNLKNLRSERGLSVADLSRRSGVSRASIMQLERGENSPTLHTLERLARGFGVSVSDLLEDTADPSTTVTSRMGMVGPKIRA